MPYESHVITDPDSQDQRWILWYGPYYDDLEFNVSNVKVNPATSKPDYATATVTYDFDDSSTETVEGSRQMSHRWELQSDLYPHVHWRQDAAGDVKWQLQYQIQDNGGAAVTSWTTITTTTTAYTYTSGSLNQISVLPTITGITAGTSFVLVIKLSRLGGDAADTMVGDAHFRSFDLHYTADAPGSRKEYIK